MQDEMDISQDFKKFYKHITFRDVLVLALIVSNIVFWFKLKDYDAVRQAAANGQQAALFIQNQLNAQNAQK